LNRNSQIENIQPSGLWGAFFVFATKTPNHEIPQKDKLLNRKVRQEGAKDAKMFNLKISLRTLRKPFAPIAFKKLYPIKANSK